MKTPDENTSGTMNSQTEDGSAVKEIMTPEHPEWMKFLLLLGGDEGCDVRKEKGGGLWICGHGIEKPLTKAILKKYFPQVDIAGSLAFFESHDGYCDCEIFINVGDIYNFSKKGKAKKPIDEKV